MHDLCLALVCVIILVNPQLRNTEEMVQATCSGTCNIDPINMLLQDQIDETTIGLKSSCR
jgi:hypothetical protein